MSVGKLDRVQREAVLSTFLDHAKEINTARRRMDAGGSYRLLAEVSNDGEWMGCGGVTRGTTTMAAHNGESVVIFFPADRFGSVADVTDAIYNNFDTDDDEEE